MKKEILVSIIIGFGLGLVITFGLYNARKAIKEQGRVMSPLGDLSTKTTPSPVVQTLSIISPIDQSISKEAKTTVSGVTSPFSWVTILAEKGEKVIRSDDKGNFETEVNLISGENEIQVKSSTENGDEISKTVTVVYSTVEI